MLGRRITKLPLDFTEEEIRTLFNINVSDCNGGCSCFQLAYYGSSSSSTTAVCSVWHRRSELGGAYVSLLSDAASYTTSMDIPVNVVIGSKYLIVQSCLLQMTSKLTESQSDK
jgi:hypothetical protein